MQLLGKPKKTARGFSIVAFKDYYGVPCSIQASSLAVYQQPGTSALWVGVDDPEPKIMASQAEGLGIITEKKTGWVSYPIPKEVSFSTRMHLDRGQVEALITHLQAWLDSETGSLI